MSPPDPFSRCPARWAVALAFLLVYLSWGTTYYVIRTGVHTYRLPPCLFGGVRVCLAGLLLLGYLGLRGERLLLTAGELGWAAVCGVILFVGGNGPVTIAMDSVPSGTASVLAATAPLFMALMETLRPRGERLTGRGWLGLFAGLAGLAILLGPKVHVSAQVFENPGPFLILGSAFAWAFGSLLMRHHRRSGSHLASAAYQMAVGGGCLALAGLACGEGAALTREHFSAGPLACFLYTLVVGSLVGFVAYHWLLGHVPAPQAGTYAYVNPLVAVLLGWIAGDEALTIGLVGGMAVILAGVALVRTGGVRPPRPAEGRREPERDVEPVAHRS